MKILIGYDGSAPADAAVEDLARAGLPAAGEALVLSVAEPWTGGVAAGVEPGWTPGTLEQSAVAVGSTRMVAENAAKQAAEAAEKAVRRVRELLPGWDVRGETCCAPPAGALLERADEWGPDLVAVGSHGRSAVGRWLLGSVSHALLIHTRCSVRIGRAAPPSDGRPLHLLIGYDGSENARIAAEAVAGRNWPARTQARLVTVRDIPLGGNGEPERLTDALIRSRSKLAVMLNEAGVSTTTEDRIGDPKQQLLEAATAWPADGLFVGARGTSAIQRLLIGSVSTALAERAGCSVEVVKRG